MLTALVVMGLAVFASQDPDIAAQDPNTQVPPPLAASPSIPRSVITTVRWAVRPQILPGDVPAQAQRDRVVGSAQVRCNILPDGTPVNCTATETPGGYGLGDAAIRIVLRGKLEIREGGYAADATFTVNLPFRLDG